MRTTITVHVGHRGPATGAGSAAALFVTTHPDVVAAMLAAARTAVDALPAPEYGVHQQSLAPVEAAAAQ